MVSGSAGDAGVEHGVDVVRPAFHALYVQPMLTECCKNGGGHSGFSASAASGTEENAWSAANLLHAGFLLSRKNGTLIQDTVESIVFSFPVIFSATAPYKIEWHFLAPLDLPFPQM